MRGKGSNLYADARAVVSGSGIHVRGDNTYRAGAVRRVYGGEGASFFQGVRGGVGTLAIIAGIGSNVAVASALVAFPARCLLPQPGALLGLQPGQAAIHRL